MTNRIGSSQQHRDKGIKAELACHDRRMAKAASTMRSPWARVDQPHHAEHEREPGREQGVEAAEQYSLDQCIEPAGHVMQPK